MNKRSVGIITYYDVCNDGAALQAYALSHVVGGLGFDCRLIDYRPVRPNARAFLPFSHPRAIIKNLITACYSRANAPSFGGSEIPMRSMGFPLRHRNFVLADWEYDRRISRLPYSGVRRLISSLAFGVRYMLHKLGVSHAR
jgi:hypothetical protein